MLDRRQAIFAMVLLLFIGGSLLHTLEYFAAFFFTDRLPDTRGFAFAFYALWLPWSAAAIGCGLAGAYAILRTNSLKSPYLTLVGALLLPSLVVDGVQLNWSILNIIAYYGSNALKVGGNGVGLAFLIWLWVERHSEASRRRATRGREALESPTA